MKVLLSGLRGSGKTSVRTELGTRTQIPSFSVGDLMEAYCQSRFPGIQREEMLRFLTIPQQTEICWELASRIHQHDSLILEAQSIMAEPYGTIIPIQPVFRSAGFQGIIVLTSHPAEILRRRKEDPNKRRQDRFLEERVEEVERQQTLMVAYFVALGVHLGVNTVLVPNTGDLESAVESCEQAIELFHKEEEFRKTWSQRGGK